MAQYSWELADDSEKKTMGHFQIYRMHQERQANDFITACYLIHNSSGRLESKIVFNGVYLDLLCWNYDFRKWDLIGEYVTFDSAINGMFEYLQLDEGEVENWDTERRCCDED